MNNHAFVVRILALTDLLLLTGCPTPIPGLVCLPISGTITGDTILAASCYEVTDDINVSDGTLTIAPGVRLIFSESTALNVNSDGRLKAIGTADLPIEFTGSEAARGHWDGIRIFSSNSIDNVLDYVTVEYAGSVWNGNLFVDGTSSEPTRISITNSTFRESSSYGIAFDADVTVDAFTGNAMTSNAMGAALVDLSGIGILTDSNTYTGNDDDVISVEGTRLLSEQTVHNVGAVYRSSRNATLSALLTIEPGVTMAFEIGRAHV